MDSSHLIPLIASQLSYYGFDSLSRQLADKAQLKSVVLPSNKLADLLEGEEEAIQDVVRVIDGEVDEILQPKYNLVVEPNATPKAPVEFTTWFTTQHREAVRSAAFSPDGKYLATGSRDFSMKILDIAKIKECYVQRNDVKPVIKTIYDHSGPVNELQFHPNGIVLASCSDDGFIKFYDLVKPSSKKSFRYFQDHYGVKSISFHPSGDFLLAGTQHNAPRVYDVHTLQCYIPTIPPNAPHQGHTLQINSVRYSPSGSIFVTASNDGTIKIWDAIGGKVTNTIESAHGGKPVTSVRFSQNAKYLLSCGLDSTGRLWDMTSGKQIVVYNNSNSRLSRMVMTFSQTEEFVFGSDENSYSLVCWDTKTGQVLKKFAAHQNVIGFVASAHADNAVISCSEDNRARIWMPLPPS